jgi:dTDP-4-amino-4,6-dideoxygalactose transaminase
VRIPLVDLKAQFGPLKREVMQAIEASLDSMELFLGPNTRAFEEEFAAYCGARHGIGVASGTEALHLALRAVGVGVGDEVVTVAHTFFGTVEAIVMTGAQPVFVDVDPRTYTMDVDQIQSRITPRTRAIVPVHLYGRVAEMDPVMRVAEGHGLVVVEDACQAHGAEYRGRRAGSLGQAGCFSFYVSKNLGAYGEAGLVTTSDPEVARKVRLLRDHGSEARYRHEVFGVNARMDEIQAAILRVKLRRLDAWNERRRRLAAAYDRLLSGLPVGRPELPADPRSHVYHLYVIRSADRDRLRAQLGERGIGTGVHYPIPAHLQPACKHLGYREGDLVETERAAGEVLSLPMYAELSEEQLSYVASAVRESLLASAGDGLGGQDAPATQLAEEPVA